MRVGVHVAYFEALIGMCELPGQRCDEFIAQRAVRARVNDESRPVRFVQRARSDVAGRTPVAMNFSVSGGTSPTAVTW